MHTCRHCGKTLPETAFTAGPCPYCGIQLVSEADGVISRPGAAEDSDSRSGTNFDSALFPATIELDVPVADEQAPTVHTDEGAVAGDQPAIVVSARDQAMVSAGGTDVEIDANVTAHYDEAANEDAFATEIGDFPEESEADTKGRPGLTSEDQLPEAMRTLIEEADPAFATEIGDFDVSDAADGSASDTAEIEPVIKSKLSFTSEKLRSKPQASESHLNIPSRALQRAGEMAVRPNLTADYVILPVNDPQRPELNGALNEGGMGVVWKAVQTSLNREVALKQIAEKHRGGTRRSKVEKLQQSFLAEAVITAELEHPNIIPIHDLGVDVDGNRLYSMKLLGGSSWDRVIAKNSEEDNLEILKKVCEAMSFAHAKGVVHRDLKPSNIMVGEHGEVLVIDWGTAFPLAHFSKASISPATSGRAGTPTYMAPEQTDVDPGRTGTHTDVYLLGAILFEVVTGIPPHPSYGPQGKTLTATNVMQLAADNVIPELDSNGKPFPSSELLDIARKAMQKSPRDRFSNVDAFLSALKSYQKHRESTQLVIKAKSDLEAADAMTAARDDNNYTMYARSVFGFENAEQLWPENDEARRGQRSARLGYAEATLQRHDYDLGLSLVKSDDPSEADLHRKLLAGREARRRQIARARLAWTTAAALLVALFVGGTGAGVWIKLERDEAVYQAAEAKRQEGFANENAKLAERNAKEAIENANLAQRNAQLADDQRAIAEGNERQAKVSELFANVERVKAEYSAAQAQFSDWMAKLARDRATRLAESEKKAKEAEEIARKEEEKAKNKAIELAEAERQARREAYLQWYEANIRLADRQVEENAYDAARETLAGIRKRRAEELDERQSLTEEEQTSWVEMFSQITRENQDLLARLERDCSTGNFELIPRYAPDGELALNPGLTAVAASPERFATSNHNGDVQLWDAVSRQASWKKPTSSVATAVALSPGQQRVAIGETSGAITVRDVGTGDVLGTLSGHEAAVNRLVYLPDGRLVSVSQDHHLRAWSVADQASKEPTANKPLQGHPGAVLSLAPMLDSTGKLQGLISGGDDGQLRFWATEADGFSLSKVVAYHDSAVTDIAAIPFPTGRAPWGVFWGDRLGNLQGIEFDPARLKESRTDSGFRQRKWISSSADRHSNGISRVLQNPVHPDQLLTVGGDNLIRAWRIISDKGIDSLTVLHSLAGHGNAIVDAATWADDGTAQLITVSKDGTARIWEVESKAGTGPKGDKNLPRQPVASGEVLSVSVGGPNFQRVLAVSRDGSGTIWDLSEPGSRPSPLYEGHQFLTQAAVRLHNRLITVSFDGTAAVWDTDSNAMVERFADVGTTGVLAGSKDARFVITGYAPPSTDQSSTPDANVQIWDLSRALAHNPLEESRRLVEVGLPNRKKVRDQPSVVAVSPDGKRAVAGTVHGFLQLMLLEDPVQIEPVQAHPKVKREPSRVPDGVTGVAWLSANELASAGLDGYLRFWIIADNELIPHPSRPDIQHRDSAGSSGSRNQYRVIALAASGEGDRRTIVTITVFPKQKDDSQWSKPQIWVHTVDADRTRPLLEPFLPPGPDEERVRSISVSNEGDRILAVMSRKSAASQTSRPRTYLQEWTWNGESFLAQTVLEPDEKDPTRFSQANYASDDGRQIVVTGDALTSLWERPEVASVFTTRREVYSPMMVMQTCDLSRDGNLAATVSHELAPVRSEEAAPLPIRGEIRLWEMNKQDPDRRWRRVASLQVEDAVNSVAFCPTDSDLLLVGGNQRLPGETRRFSSILYRRDGNTLASVQSVGSHERPVVRVQFSADGRRLMSAAADGSIHVWDRTQQEYEPRHVIDASRFDSSFRLGALTAADLSEDGRWLVVSDKLAAVIVDVETGRPVVNERLQGHAGDLTDVRFAIRTADDAPRRLWSTSLDGAIRFWAITESNSTFVVRPMLTLRGHERGVLALAARPGGEVVSGGSDGRVILWPLTHHDH